MDIEGISKWVGLIGGAIGILAAGTAAATVVIQYFATRSELQTVDCYAWHMTQMLDARTEQLALITVLEQRHSDAARAEVVWDADRSNSVKLEAFNKAAEKQKDAHDQLKAVRARSEQLRESMNQCGYRVPDDWLQT